MDAIEQRRLKLVADLRAEGAPETVVARLATSEIAARMLAHEDRVCGMILNAIFHPGQRASDQEIRDDLRDQISNTGEC